ncbi:uncharacterized protein LOC131944433 [Physella acuta]|uniref:uncharacterized protein LOC131944433 n=1 Tax=Physella acuta TaxID=109671 RepID=UPI0027DB3194|nr:uncharacterized protein LOC131944433 [Physella acuta]
MSRAFNRFRNWNKVSPNSPSKVFLAYAAENEITVIPCEETFVIDNQAHENYESSSTDVQDTTDVSSHEDTHPIQLPSHESNEAQQKNKTFAVPIEFITKPFDFKHPLMICWFYNDNKDNEVVKNIITGLDSCFTNTRYHSETEISQTPISVTLDKEMLQWAFFGKISSNDKQLIERLLNSGISVLYPKIELAFDTVVNLG